MNLRPGRDPSPASPPPPHPCPPSLLTSGALTPLQTAKTHSSNKILKRLSSDVPGVALNVQRPALDLILPDQYLLHLQKVILRPDAQQVIHMYHHPHLQLSMPTHPGARPTRHKPHLRQCATQFLEPCLWRLPSPIQLRLQVSNQIPPLLWPSSCGSSMYNTLLTGAYRKANEMPKTISASGWSGRLAARLTSNLAANSGATVHVGAQTKVDMSCVIVAHASCPQGSKLMGDDAL